MLQIVITGAFFCYGMYTLQRTNFLLDKLPKVLWKRFFPKAMHEALFSCGICVSSIWGTFFLVCHYLIINFVAQQYQLLANIPFYIIAMCGICALVDRAVKFFEYGYKYSGIVPESDYSYLNKFEFRDKLYDCFLQAAINKDYPIIEVGGTTETLTRYPGYLSVDKKDGHDLQNTQLPRDKFILVKGLALEGNFDHLLLALEHSKGFIIESSIGGESGKQVQWILDKFDGVIKLNYSISNFGVSECPEHCGNNVNNRIILIQPVQ